MQILPKGMQSLVAVVAPSLGCGRAFEVDKLHPNDMFNLSFAIKVSGAHQAR